MVYKKIALFGFPASGKSTFAKYLNEKTNIQVYSLDLIRWANMKNGKKDKEYKDRLVIIHNYDELSDEMMIL